MRCFACVGLLLTLGGILPPGASSQPYRLVCSYFDEPRAGVYQIDGGGNVTLEQNLTVMNDSFRVTPSPDGRVFVVSPFSYFIGDLPVGIEPPWFFVGADGSIARALQGPRPAVPTVFFHDGNLSVSGSDPCRTLFVDHATRSLELTGYEFGKEIPTGPNGLALSYSLSLLVWSSTSMDCVQGVPFGSRGEFGNGSEPFFFSDKGSNGDMGISPDGQFVTVIGLENPQLAIIGVNFDGSFFLVETHVTGWPNWGPCRVRYTPDGRHLLVLADTEPFLSSYRVDQVTGKLQLVDTLFAADWLPGGGYLIDALGVTPDSAFAVVPNLNLTQNASTFLVYRIESDGTLTRITQTRNDWPGYVSDMDFIPPYREPVTAAGTGWMLYQ